jgi:hypothetical protein
MDTPGTGEDMYDEDPILDGLDPETIDLGEFTVLEGAFGRSSAEGHWRLYQTRWLDTYFELREDQIERRRTDDGRTLVWVRRDAIVKFVRIARLDDFTVDLFGNPAGPLMQGFPWDPGSGLPVPERGPYVSRKSTVSACH